MNEIINYKNPILNDIIWSRKDIKNCNTVDKAKQLITSSFNIVENNLNSSRFFHDGDGFTFLYGQESSLNINVNNQSVVFRANNVLKPKRIYLDWTYNSLNDYFCHFRICFKHNSNYYNIITFYDHHGGTVSENDYLYIDNNTKKVRSIGYTNTKLTGILDLDVSNDLPHCFTDNAQVYELLFFNFYYVYELPNNESRHFHPVYINEFKLLY